MKRVIRVLIAGLATAGMLAGIQIYSDSSVTWIPSLVGFVISTLAAWGLIHVRLPGGNGIYRLAVIMTSWVLLGLLVGVVMGGGPVTPLSLVAGVSLVGIGAVIMWPMTIAVILVYLLVDFVIERR